MFKNIKTFKESIQTNTKCSACKSTNNSKDNIVKDENKKVQKKGNKKEKIKNENVSTFSEFILNEDGGVAATTAGNTSGMGDVSVPPVSIDGSVYTYNGTGNPTETVGRGSGDIAATNVNYFSMGNKTYKRNKRNKKRINKEHFGVDQPKEKMYVTSYTDWSKREGSLL